MTKQPFEAVAAALRLAKPRPEKATASPAAVAMALAVWKNTAIQVRDAISRFNPRFNFEKFDLAAGIAGQSE